MIWLKLTKAGLLALILNHAAEASALHRPLDKNAASFARRYREMKSVERFHAYCLADIDYFSDPESENCRKSVQAINDMGDDIQMGQLPPDDITVLRRTLIEMLKNTEQRR